MLALVVGLVIVVVSAVAFGAAMFGRRPVPQPATATRRVGPDAVTPPSSATGPNPAAAGGPVPGPPTGATTAVRRDRQAASVRVTIPTSVKVRSGVLLALTVLALAAFVGVVLGVVAVAVGLFVA